MKKVFLSCPMRNRTKESIEASLEKMKVCAKLALGDDIEFIHTIVKETAPETANKSIWYLGKSIQLLSEADVLVTVEVPYYIYAPGVQIEYDIFESYYDDSVILKLPIELITTKEELAEMETTSID